MKNRTWNKFWIFGFIASLLFSMLVWAWMLGFFAVSPSGLAGSPFIVGTMAKWSRPGILAIPALVSVLVPIYAALRMQGKDLPWNTEEQ